MAAGDHILVKRAGGLYYHHGIDMGDGTVIHFAGEPLQRHLAEVCRVPVEEFLQGGKLVAADYPDPAELLPSEETLRLAEAQVGKSGYSVLWNNCEHLAVYCKTGAPQSRQVRRYFKIAGTMVVVGVASISMALVTRMVEKKLGRRA